MNAEEVSVPETSLIRIAAIAEYDGTGFAGLQRQRDQPSIQSAFEDMARAFGVAECHFRAAGRTDSGVHARGQVICLDLPSNLNGKNVVSAMNWHLPESVRVRRVALSPDGFDPRRHAIRRTYRYLLCGGQAFPALMRGRMGRIRGRLDLGLMRQAAEVFTGRHDFRAWRSTQCQARRTVLDMQRIEIRPWLGRAPHGMDLQTFEITFVCRSFLHRMVRYLVGGISQAGAGALTPDALARHLDAKTLPPRVTPADACGLSLESVEYPSERDPFPKTPQDPVEILRW